MVHPRDYMASAADPPHSIVPRLLVLFALIGVLALIGWALTQRTSDHWEEVARARRYLEQGQTDPAFQAVAAIRDERPGAAEGLAIAGRILLQRGNVSPARRILERSLRIKPEQADAAKMLAAIYLAAGDGQLAVKLLRRAAELDPPDFRPWYALGKVYHDLGNFKESAEAYAQALQRSPPSEEAKESRIGRIRSLLDANRAIDASAELEEIRNQNPDVPEVLALAARQARDLGRLNESVDLANRALRLDSNNFDAYLARARANFQLRLPKKALEDLQRAVQVNPNDPGALQLLIQVQRSMGRTAEAAATQERADRTRSRIALMDQLTKTIDQRPNDPEPRYRMGQAAMEGEMNVLAFQCFQAALDIDPGYKPARAAMRTLLVEKKFDPRSIKDTKPRFTTK
jgi:tetratricopeptide (TPR) repeat protein